MCTVKLCTCYIHLHAYHLVTIEVFKKFTELETKASSHEGQCILAGYCYAHMPLYGSGINYNVNIKYTKYFEQLCCQIFTFWNISTTN